MSGLHTIRTADSLFAIDVDAQIRKLAERQYKAVGEPAVELIRFAAGLQTTTVNVSLKRRLMVIDAEEARLSEEMFEKISVVFDDDRKADERHRAIVDLEEKFGLGVLAAFAGSPSRVVFEWGDGMLPRGLEFIKGRSPRRFTPEWRDGLQIRIFGRRQPKRETAFIAERCRFARIPIRVNGKRFSHGIHMDACLLQADIRNNRLRGAVGIPSRGDIARIIRLTNGIIEEEVVLPSWQGLVITAVISERDLDSSATRGTLRRAGIRLYTKLAMSYEKLSDRSKARALDLLIERFRSTDDERLLIGVPVFQRVGGTPLDISMVRNYAKKGPVYAIDIDAPIAHYSTTSKLVLRLDTQQRRFLDRDLKVTLSNPAPRARKAGLPVNLTVWMQEIRHRLMCFFSNRAGNRIRDGRLGPRERNFLEAVRDEIRSGGFAMAGEERPFGVSVSFSVGQRRALMRIDRAGDAGEYRISRSHKLVRKMIVAYSKDRAYLYPALYALTDGHDGYADSRQSAQRAILD
jgi:hypothetical protein